MIAEAADRCADIDLLRMLAKSEYRRRRMRSRVFDTFNLDGEPAWDILLDLFATGSERAGTRVTSVCIASAVPTTTALRHLGILEQAGMIEIRPDRTDARARAVSLTPKADTMMRAYFSKAWHSS